MDHLIVPVNIRKKSEVSHWPTPLSLHGCLKWELLGGIRDSGFASIERAFLPWVGLSASEHITRASRFHSHSGSSPTTSLDLLAKVFLDSHTALDYLLCEQGGICAITNTTCCTWVKCPGEVETQLCKIREPTLVTTNVTQLSVVL